MRLLYIPVTGHLVVKYPASRSALRPSKVNVKRRFRKQRLLQYLPTCTCDHGVIYQQRQGFSATARINQKPIWFVCHLNAVVQTNTKTLFLFLSNQLFEGVCHSLMVGEFDNLHLSSASNLVGLDK